MDGFNKRHGSNIAKLTRGAGFVLLSLILGIKKVAYDQ